ncbi:YciI family protein [Sphingobium fluviale]|uniref:YCII-related domain-containing protein n=1 Tax=Sphingobium fluviale TaxID=2506423 RepID=A0A4Q1KLG9_9SPHN|nr:YciI family protein [Sphingobium fluviale]RXR30325.1 hypothetical protein EQG66_03040 [Sphingobium fluviale]
MFIIFLAFSDNRSKAAELMDAHKKWIREGLESGEFLLVGSLAGGAGGAILARSESREAIDARIACDPFVTKRVVSATVHEFVPGQAAPNLRFLLDQEAA